MAKCFDWEARGDAQNIKMHLNGKVATAIRSKTFKVLETLEIWLGGVCPEQQEMGTSSARGLRDN
jgi:hypothetical protein